MRDSVVLTVFMYKEQQDLMFQIPFILLVLFVLCVGAPAVSK